MRPAEIDWTVAQIDETRRAEQFRIADRADARFVKPYGRVPKEVVKAQTRLRTALWRNRMDQRRRPTVDQLGRALVVAFACHPDWREIFRLEGTILERALDDLQARGFSVAEAQDVMRKLRWKMVDPADRADEESESCSAPIEPERRG